MSFTNKNNSAVTEIAPSQTQPPRRWARRAQTRQAMALVGIMLVLMLILAGSLVGFAVQGVGSSGDLGSSSNNMLQLTKRRLSVMNAETLADAGIRSAVQWISELAGPPLNSAAFTPREVTPTEFYAGSLPVDVGKWTVVNFPDAADASKGQFKVRFYPHQDNTTAAQRAFLVESVGAVDGITRVVRADIQQQNFARYAYFTDDVGPGTLIAGRTTFNGPVHMNNSNGVDINVIWDSTSVPSIARMFQWDGDNTFTMWRGADGNNASRVKWQKNTSGNFAAPASDAEWKNVITPEQSGVARTGPKATQDKVTMPTTSNEQRDAAHGGVLPSSYGQSEGVYVPSTGGANATSGTPTGGVVIRGQVEDMVLEAVGTGNRDQIIHVYQNRGGDGASKSKYTLRMNADGTTTVKKFTRGDATKPFAEVSGDGYPKSYSGGATNGVIYSNEDIGNWSPNDGTGGVSGTVANSAVDAGGVPTQLSKLNICTRIEGSPTSGNQKTINIDGNILYANADKLAPAAPADAGVLGLVAGYIKIVPRARVVEDGPVGNPRVTGFANRAVAEDGAYANGATLDTLSVHATLMSFNTIKIDSYDTRPKGQFRLLGGYIAQVGSRFGTAVGGTGVNAFNVATGFERILSYDKRVANQPPPFFPGTGQSYEVISYQRLLAPLQP